MEIICHRGYFESSNEQNSLTSFEKAFNNGFGIETDIRDANSEIVISHNIPSGNETPLEDLLKLYKEIGNNLPLALDIKSSELQYPLRELLDKYQISNYFLFDMAIPDAIKFAKDDNNIIYARQSEYEMAPNLYEESSGIWMDEFYSDWIDINHIEEHKKNGKKVALVSPELHGKEHLNRWAAWKKIEQKLDYELSICVNYPNEANLFFNK